MSRLCSLLLTAAALVSCAAPLPTPKQYAMEGEIMRLDPDQMAVIKHRDIVGWMKAMTMDYPIRDKEEYLNLKVGEHIQATVNVRGDDYWVSNIRQYQSDKPAAASSPAAPRNAPKGN